MGSLLSVESQNENTLLEQVALAGRKTELRQFLKALTLCRTGQGKAILLSGNEGIGKTALLETFFDLAEKHYGCGAVTVKLPANPSPSLLFAFTVQAILDLANRVVREVLKTANQILEPIGIRWSQNDLIQIVALMRLQEATGNQQSIAVDQLSQSIMAQMSFFKRRDSAVHNQISQLAEVLVHPWVTLGVSLLNPMNTQVQQAVDMTQRILGEGIPVQRRLPSPMAPMMALEGEEGSEAPNEADETDLPDPDSDQPSLSQLQKMMASLLNHINSGLRQYQSAFLLAFDQWEGLASSSELLRKETGDFLKEVFRQTVEQRNCHLMVVVVCRSEADSYAMDSGLYNALRTKYLIPSLPRTAHQRLLKDRLEMVELSVEEVVLQHMAQVCQGNPAWSEILMRVIEADMHQWNLNHLDETTYHERFLVKQPSDLLELLFTRLQLGFVGRESQFLKAVNQLMQQVGFRSFERTQAHVALSGVSLGDTTFVDDLLNGLAQYGFLENVSDNASSPRYRFYQSFMAGYLMKKARPLQQDIPTPDKVASLKKVLPLSIQSGELNQEKTQELLAMASALNDPELTRYVEQTLIDALHTDETPMKTRVTLLESLSYMGTTTAVEAILQVLESPDADLRETACSVLMPLSTKAGNSPVRQRILDQMIPLVDDPKPSVRYQAFQCLAVSPVPSPEVNEILLSGATSTDPTIRFITLSGLERRHLDQPEVLELYRNILTTESDVNLVKVALKGLQRFDRETVIPELTAFLERHEHSPLWMEVLLQLIQMDFPKAFPWVSKVLEADVDPEIQLAIIKRLGSKPNAEVEKLLIRTLQRGNMLPELRWMAIRSLGWIGQSIEAIRTLQAQTTYCQSDEILDHALVTAIRSIQERLETFSSAPSPHGAAGKSAASPVYALKQAENGREKQEQPADSDTIELVVVTKES